MIDTHSEPVPAVALGYDVCVRPLPGLNAPSVTYTVSLPSPLLTGNLGSDPIHSLMAKRKVYLLHGRLTGMLHFKALHHGDELGGFFGWYS